MIRIPGRIPILIYPTFWLVAALIGFLYSGNVIGTAIWIGIIFVSVLFHELGHAITAFAFGLKPHIELVAMGGITFHEGDKLPFWKRFFIVLDGPLFGFLLFLIATVLLQVPSIATSTMGSVLTLVQVVNLFWTIVNLIPVIPLDGGQLLRVVLEAIFGLKGFRYALMSCLMGALFFSLTFQSYDGWRKTKFISEPDRSDAIKASLTKAEELLNTGHKPEAMAALIALRTEAKKGLIFNMATQYLAFLEFEKGNVKQTYELLKDVSTELAPDAMCLLHKAAFEEKDYPLVIKLSADSFQILPTVDTALRNAYAHGELAEPEAAIGWLETATREGLQNISDVISHSSFDPIRNDSHFIAWQSSHKM
ncbi:MAG: M50 family metallopeptidase [Chlamydiae bacterium]|nr:M50 family metallopeptidase [Chlamydiota bacterium]